MSKNPFLPTIEPDWAGFEELLTLVAGRRLAVLTGAGCSTASGIPDYRGPETIKKERRPILYREFVGDAAARRRYWARSALGWPKIKSARPNQAHHTLAAWEEKGRLSGLITQNVDRLHRRAGSREVVDLHGALEEVICLGCRAVSSRDELQERLKERNPGWARYLPDEREAIAPDGDVEIPAEITEAFEVPACRECGGVLKPNVVFFGENVARPVVDRAWEMLFGAEMLLVLGSSLTVFSGYRFVRAAAKEEIPVGIINIGPTRGDGEASVRLEARVGEALKMLDEHLA